MKAKRDPRRVRKAVRMCERKLALKSNAMSLKIDSLEKSLAAEKDTVAKAEYNITERLRPFLDKVFEVSCRSEYGMFRGSRIGVCVHVDAEVMRSMQMSRDPMRDLLWLGQNLGVQIARGLYDEAKK